MAALDPLISEHLNLAISYAELPFLDGQAFKSEKPYTIAGPLPPSQESVCTNLQITSHEVRLRDLRNFEHQLDIETKWVRDCSSADQVQDE